MGFKTQLYNVIYGISPLIDGIIWDLQYKWDLRKPPMLSLKELREIVLKMNWLHKKSHGYPLAICYIAIENDHRNSGFTH